MSRARAAQVRGAAGEDLVFEGVRVEGQLTGALLDATVIQRFRNPGDAHVEVVYTFPLPWAAVLLGVEVELGGRRLSGAVVEKSEAEGRYEQVLGDGDAAIMLEENRDGSFTLNLGNLAPHETCVIRLRYSQVLSFEQRSLRVLIPTVIAPRYGDPVRDGGLRLHQTVEHGPLVEYPFALSLKLEGELARARIASPTHPVDVHVLPGEEVEVTLTCTGMLDRDFVLVLSELAHDSVAVMAGDLPGSEAVAVLTSFCPRVEHEPLPVVAKVLVDCSGSMNGDSIAAARRALQSVIGQFGDQDRFSLSRFGSSVQHRGRGLWRATPVTRLAAQRWVSELQADLGGTEMEAALESTFALGGDAAGNVLLITDGQINAIDRTIASAREAGQRVFVVGVGSSPSEGLLRRLAEESGGACDFVAPGEAVEPAVLRMFARLRTPRLVDLSVQWPAGMFPVWTSGLDRAAFVGDTVNVFAGFERAVDGDVRLVARRGQDAAWEVVARTTLGAVTPGDVVSRMGAAARVRELAPNRRSAARMEATRLALDYRLISKWTNFLLVAERADSEKAQDMPELVKLKSMLPAGWGGAGSVMYSVRAPVGGLQPSTGGAGFDVPAVLRSRRRSVDDLPPDDNLPAFLRRRNLKAIDRSDPRYWSRMEYYTGLTPLGMCEWLRVSPCDNWPGTWQELRRIGVGAAVVDWLEFVVGEELEEMVMVAAFVRLMAQRETRAALETAQGVAALVNALLVRLGDIARREPRPESPAVPEAVSAHLIEALAGMSADRWPESVFALETAEMRHEA